MDHPYTICSACLCFAHIGDDPVLFLQVIRIAAIRTDALMHRIEASSACLTGNTVNGESRISAHSRFLDQHEPYLFIFFPYSSANIGICEKCCSFHSELTACHFAFSDIERTPVLHISDIVKARQVSAAFPDGQ